MRRHAKRDGQNWYSLANSLLGHAQQILQHSMANYCICEDTVRKTKTYHFKNRKILGPHSSVSQDSGLLGCDTVSLGEWSLAFQGNTVPPYSTFLEHPDGRR